MSDTPLAGVRLLLVDDDERVRAGLQEYFADCGAIVVEANSARAGLRAFLALRPDVLVSDIRMPGEDGMWLINAIRALPADVGGTVPALALTGDANAVDEAAEAGFCAVRTKPPQLEELVTLVAELASR